VRLIDIYFAYSSRDLIFDLNLWLFRFSYCESVTMCRDSFKKEKETHVCVCVRNSENRSWLPNWAVHAVAYDNYISLSVFLL